MAKSRGAKRGRKKKRIAAHIKEAQGKRKASALSSDDSKATQPVATPAIGGRLRPSKRPRDSGSLNVADTTRDDKERTEASSYLSAWLSARRAKQAAEEGDSAVVIDVWKFNKKTQAWLLRHMFAENEVSEQSFSTICLYLEGLKGGARQRVLAEAQQIMDKHGPDEEVEQTAAARLADSNDTKPARKRVRFEGDSSDSESVETNMALGAGSSNSEGESSDEEKEGTGVANDDARPTEKKRKKVRSASERQAKAEAKARAASVAYERALKVAEVLS